MTPRTRRFVGAAVALIALLLLGRWTTAFLAERWWAAAISPAAAAFTTRWHLMGLAYDVIAASIASAWFVMQALVVARAIASVQLTHRLGDIQLRETVSTRLLLGGAVLSGILLGLIAGAGAHTWRDSMAIAAQGVTFGVLDPLLNLDVGVLVAQLPAWDLIQRYVALLGVLGFAFCFALYSGIGALRRENGVIVVHPDARRHLGVLVAFVALTIAAAYRLEPYHLAASSSAFTLAGELTRVHGAQIVSGIALAAALLSLVWAVRGRNSVLMAGWLVLAVAALAERYAIPALAERGPASPSRITAIRRFDALAWGIRQDPAANEAERKPTTTALWDDALLGRLAQRRGGMLEAATAAETRGVDGEPHPTWLVAATRADDSARLDVMAVVDGVAMPSGMPTLLRTSNDFLPDVPVWYSLPVTRSRPSAPEWRSVGSGVDAASPLRRVLLAWARQAPGLLGAKALPDVDWHLDPVERAASVLPMFSWLPADLMLVDGRPVWLVEGMRVSEEFPLATRSRWRDRRVAGVSPAVLGTVDAASGETHFYADPAADSLAIAWTKVIGSLVASSAAIPAEIVRSIPYRPEWFQAQLPALAGPGWNAGQLSPRTGAVAAVWQGGRIPALQVALEESGRSMVSTIVTAYRIAGVPRVRVDLRAPSVQFTDNRIDFKQLWSRGADLMHLKDSVTAAGDSVWLRPLRWYAGSALVAWQAVFAVPKIGAPALLWVSTELGDRVGGGRTVAEAWRSVTETDYAAAPHHPEESAILESARRAVQRADTALRRGDMTAFGRAFEDLRRALQRPIP